MRRLAVILPAILLSTLLMAETVERSVKANTRSAIGGFLGYEVDTCYPSVIPAVKVRQQPGNGSIQVISHEQVLSKETRCAGTKVRGVAYIYTPKKGFKGTDELSLDVPWQSTDTGPEILRTYTYKIRVE